MYGYGNYGYTPSYAQQTVSCQVIHALMAETAQTLTDLHQIAQFYYSTKMTR